jgi:hypothetical protein
MARGRICILIRKPQYPGTLGKVKLQRDLGTCKYAVPIIPNSTSDRVKQQSQKRLTYYLLHIASRRHGPRHYTHLRYLSNLFQQFIPFSEQGPYPSRFLILSHQEVRTLDSFAGSLETKTICSKYDPRESYGRALCCSSLDR